MGLGDWCVAWLVCKNLMYECNKNIEKATKWRPDFWHYTDLSKVGILVCTGHTHTHTHVILVCTRRLSLKKIIRTTLRLVRSHTMTHFHRRRLKKDQASKSVISAVTAVPSRHDLSSVEKQLVAAGSICHPPSLAWEASIFFSVCSINPKTPWVTARVWSNK